MRFSQRQGIKSEKKNIQFESIDTELQNGLWNLVKLLILDRISKYNPYGGETQFHTFSLGLWHNFYKLPIDTIPKHDVLIEQFIRENFFRAEWYNIYDLIEFLAGFQSTTLNEDEFIPAVNRLLEQEFSAFRFIEGKLLRFQIRSRLMK